MVKLIDVTGKVVSGEWGNDDLVGIGIPVLRTTNFNNDGTINYDNIVTRAITKTKINDKYLLNGDILIASQLSNNTQSIDDINYVVNHYINNPEALIKIKNKLKDLSASYSINKIVTIGENLLNRGCCTK